MSVTRRLFSLAGVFPLGLFLLEHAVLSAAALGGARAFARALHVLGSPPVHAAHVALVWLPLGFHAAYGLHLVLRRLPLREPSPYPPRVRALVRLTGVLALAFVTFHVFECRLGSSGAFDRGEVAYSRLAESLSALTWGVPWRGLAYLVGLGATVVHFGWGLWAYLVSNGCARARALAASAAALVVFFTVGASSVVSFATGSHPFYVPIDRGPNAEVPCPSASHRERALDTTMAAKKTSTRSENGSVRRVIVVGGGLAGLMTVIKLCEAGVPVDIFSLVPVKRSHSVCAQGGINASVDTKGEGDSPQVHLEETVYGGDFLANQPPVKGMADAAPNIVFMLDRMGVPFNRTPEGLLDFRRFGGTLFHRTAFAGATTGQQLLYALDEQVRRFEIEEVGDETGVAIPGEKMVRKFEWWDFLALVLDDTGTARGIVAQDVKSMAIRAFPGDAVCLATGGPGIVFGRSTNSVINTGTAASQAFQQGACYANGEFIQVHPTAIPGADKLRLISESARGEGGRVWVPRDAKEKRPGRDVPEKDRDYFLEEKYPGYGNLVPRDIASRELFLKCIHQGRGIYNQKTGQNEHEVYLDLTHLPREALRKKLAGVLEIYEKFAGEDPYENPMKVFPAVHYSMGGLWVDFERAGNGSLVVGSPRNQATNIPGLYACGEVDYQYHGANRLGANSLLSCLYGGMVTGPAIVSYRKGMTKSSWDFPESLFTKAEKREEKKYDALVGLDGEENPYRLHEELGHTMLVDCTIERDNARLDKVLEKIEELAERSRKVGAVDTSRTLNNPARFTRHLFNMIVLARVIAQGARNRDESRGAHFKPAFKDRDDARWLRTTLAFHQAGAEGGHDTVRYVRELDYAIHGKGVHVTDAVDTSLVRPRPRKYEQAGAASAVATAGGGEGPKSVKPRASAP